ncbi:hypothetical protein GDO78_018669, partial [Eleutherodactylus coqui]
DVYVFGLGDETDNNEINELASKKNPEKHVFKMQSISDMLTAFDEMLDVAEILQMCGLSREFPPDQEEDVQEKFPWIAKITIT